MVKRNWWLFDKGKKELVKVISVHQEFDVFNFDFLFIIVFYHVGILLVDSISSSCGETGCDFYDITVCNIQTSYRQFSPIKA